MLFLDEIMTIEAQSYDERTRTLDITARTARPDGDYATLVHLSYLDVPPHVNSELQNASSPDEYLDSMVAGTYKSAINLRLVETETLKERLRPERERKERARQQRQAECDRAWEVWRAQRKKPTGS